LRALGVELRRITIVPDEIEDIAATVVESSQRFDYVFTSGGVGPTHDDVTMVAIAKAFGTALIRHPELEVRIRAYWKDQLADANLRLADVPDGAVLVYGSDQLWPVVSYKNVFIMPGVPALFKRKFIDIRDQFRALPVSAARLYVDLEEGELAPHLDAIVAAYPAVKVGSYPRFAERDFRVLVTLESAGANEVGAAYRVLAERLGAHVVRADEPRTVGA
jgi:molybdopterin-biosynthesis enzyme MoeA-like protein